MVEQGGVEIVTLVCSMHQNSKGRPYDKLESNNVGPESIWISGFAYEPDPVPSTAIKHGAEGQLTWTGNSITREGGKFVFHDRETAAPDMIKKIAGGIHYQGWLVKQG